MWARLDDAILDNPKIIAAGPLATLLHIAAIVWSARNLTDGFIPAAKVATLVNWRGALAHIELESDADEVTCTGRRIESDDFVDQLLTLQLWHEVPGGYQIHDFLDYNRSKKQVLAERARSRARQEDQRSRRDTGGTPPESQRCHSGPVPVPVPVPVPGSVPIPQETLALASLACAPPCAPLHEFDEFWKAYPRKCDKQRARKAWAKLRPPPLKAILDALAWQRELPDWRKENGEFVPYPASYLNGRRWEDERPAPQLAGTTSRTAGNLEAIKAGLNLVGS